TPLARSAVADRKRDVAGGIALFHPHQHGALAAGAGFADHLADVARRRNLLAGNFENDVPGREAVVGGDAGGVDSGDDNAVAAGAGNTRRGRQRQAELGDIGADIALLVVGSSIACFLLLRQFAERQRQRLFGALVQQREPDGGLGLHRADALGEIARVLDLLAVDGGDDVARLDARLGGRAIGLRFGNQSTLRLLQAEAVGDILGHRLDLHADPTARDRAMVLELTDDGLDRVGGDRKGNADGTAGRREDRRIDADHIAFGVERGTARIALVHGRVDLDEIVIGAGADVA